MTFDGTRPRPRLGRLARSAVLAVLVACSCPTSAFAQRPADDIQQPDVERAEGHAERAYQAYVQKRYETALSLYIEAYKAAPAPDILYNIARIYELGLHDHGLAIQFYRGFIADPDADPGRVEVASARLKALEEATRAAPVTANPAPSKAVPHAPSDARREPSSARTDRVTESDGWSPLRVGAVLSAGAGLAALGVGAIFGVDAASQAKIVHDDCDGDLCTSERGLSAARAATKSADVATLSFALGGLLAAAAATMLWVDLDAPRDPVPSSHLRWSPLATDSKLGLALSGRW